MTPFEPDPQPASASPDEPTAPSTTPATEPPAAPSAETPAPAPRRSRARGVVRPAILAVALIATFGVGVGVGRVDLGPIGEAAASPTASFTPGEEFALVQEAWDLIHQKYVAADELNDRDLAYAAIDGLTEAVGDTGHTEFMTPEERAARRAGLSGSYVGIGAEVDTTEDDLPVIVGVFRGSPAERGGLHSGDIVLTVDDRPTAGETLETVIGWIRGEDGTKVVLTVRDGAEGPVRTVELVRDDVHIEPVSWAMVPGTKTAVLRLEQFSSGAADALHKALEEINTAGAERLVFDLRGNPGGYVNEATAIASEFLASGDVYLERNAQGTENATAVRPGGIATKIPLVVLIDEGHRERGRDRLGRDPGRGSRRAHRREDVRDRDGPRRVRAGRRLRAPHRDGRVADAEGPRHLARGDLA